MITKQSPSPPLVLVNQYDAKIRLKQIFRFDHRITIYHLSWNINVYSNFVPLFSCVCVSGIFGVRPEDVARIMVDEIANEAQNTSSSIREIFLVDIAPRTVTLLQDAMNSKRKDFKRLDSFRGSSCCPTDPKAYNPAGQ